MAACEIEYFLARLLCETIPFISFINLLSPSETRHSWCLSPFGIFLFPVRWKCRVFSRLERYSRFSNRLLVLFRSLWLTVRLLGPTNVSITSLWILNDFHRPHPRFKIIEGYPWCKYVARIFCLMTRPFLKWLFFLMRATALILPKSLISYRPLYFGIGRQFSIFFIILICSGCATIELPDISPGITLPASEICFRISTLGQVEQFISKEECESIRKRSIFLTSEDWAKLKFTLLKNCITNKCKQTAGALDDLFITLDDALKELP